jgi:hypothetical protein
MKPKKKPQLTNRQQLLLDITGEYFSQWKLAF